MNLHSLSAKCSLESTPPRPLEPVPEAVYSIKVARCLESLLDSGFRVMEIYKVFLFGSFVLQTYDSG